MKAILGIMFLLLSISPAPWGLKAAPMDAAARFEIELEAGPVWQTVNDVQIPNNNAGTRFSLVDFAGKGPWAAPRVYFTWNIRPRHSVRLLAAPLSYTESGEFGAPVDFEGESFEAGVSTDALNATRDMTTWGGKVHPLAPAHVVLRTVTHIYHHMGQVAAMCRILGHPVLKGVNYPILD